MSIIFIILHHSYARRESLTYDYGNIIGQSVNMIKGLKGYIFYETFAYHVATLRQLINRKETQEQRGQTGLNTGDKFNRSVHGSRVFSRKKGFGLDRSGTKGSDPDGSTKSMSNFRGTRVF